MDSCYIHRHFHSAINYTLVHSCLGLLGSRVLVIYFHHIEKTFFFWFELNFFCSDHILIFLLYLSRAVHHTVFLVSRTSNREERVLEVNHRSDRNLLRKQNKIILIVFAFSLTTQKYYHKKSAGRIYRIIKYFWSRHVGTKFSFGLGSVKSFKNSLNFKLKFTE